MNDFLKVLQDERAKLEPTANGDELPALREQLATAKAARQKFRDGGGDERASRSQTVAREAVQLDNACIVPRDRIEILQTQQKSAERRIAEIDALLCADANLKEARAAWANGAKQLKDLNASAAQFDAIIASYRDDIEKLAQEQQEALAEHGAADLDARLSGKSVPIPKSLGSNELILSLRKAALGKAEGRRKEIQESIDALLKASADVRNRLRTALARKAESDYYVALPTLLPSIARLIALGSWIGGGRSSNEFTIRCDDEFMSAISAEIDKEIAATATSEVA